MANHVKGPSMYPVNPVVVIVKIIGLLSRPAPVENSETDTQAFAVANEVTKFCIADPVKDEVLRPHCILSPEPN